MPTRAEIQALVEAEARRQGIDPALAVAVARQESGMSQHAKSAAGAIGVMQLMPGTAERLHVDPTDLAQNIEGGVRYLKQMGELFPDSREKQLAAYNAGPGNVVRYKGVPPFKETQGFVASITRMLTPPDAAAAPIQTQDTAARLKEIDARLRLLNIEQRLDELRGAQQLGAASRMTATPVTPAPATPSALRNPLAPGMPEDAPLWQQADAERLQEHEQRLQEGTRAAREALAPVGATHVLLPGQTGMPVERSGRNPLAPPGQQLRPVTPEQVAQGYGTVQDALRTGQRQPWLINRAKQPAVWRQAMDTGARVATGLATGGASLPVQAAGQMLTEGLTQAAGLQPPSAVGIARAGLVETAGNMVLPLALRVFRGILRRTRGGKQLAHDTRIGEARASASQATEEAEFAAGTRRQQLEGQEASVTAQGQQATRALEERQRALEAFGQQAGQRLTFGQGQLDTLQGEARSLATEADLQSRELRAIRPGVMRGMEQQLKGRADVLEDIGIRTQAAVRGRLGALSSEQAEALLRRIGQFGPEVSDEAVTAAYRQLNDVKRLSVNPSKLYEALSTVHPSVREGMKEALSVIPERFQGLSFGQLRAIQTSLGKNIRSLERSIARNMDDMNGPVRLDALKRLYTSTFDVLEETVQSRTATVWQPSKVVGEPDRLVTVRFPADTRALLEEANTLNRIVSTMDRVETLWNTKAVSIVAGQEVFDAVKMLRAIKADAFLERMLKKDGLYDGLTTTLQKIAVAQKTGFKSDGVSIAELQGFNQQMAREESLRDLRRARTVEQLHQALRNDADRLSRQVGALKYQTGRGKATLQEDIRRVGETTHRDLESIRSALAEHKTWSAQELQSVQQRLRETEARIDAETPGQQASTITGDIVRPLIGGGLVGGVTGKTGAGVSTAVAIATMEGAGRLLLSRQGQRWLTQVFAKDASLSAPKIGFLLNAARSQQEETDASPGTNRQ